MLDEAAVTKFKDTLRGPVIRPDDPGYDEARKLYNAHDRQAAACSSRAAPMWRTSSRPSISAATTGCLSPSAAAAHNGPGFASVDDGLVIDLSTMKGVRFDPKSRTVRVGPGCTTGEVDHATHPFGQAVPFGIISTTGVAGLTLSGGMGISGAQYGLASTTSSRPTSCSPTAGS